MYREDRELLTGNTHLWPHFPLMLMKKESQQGIILADTPLTIYLTNLSEMPVKIGDWNYLETKEFQSVEEMEERGWEVDG